MNALEYKLIRADNGLKQVVIAMLEENNLPTIDLDARKNLFALLQNDQVMGTGGLEFFDRCALLRSVSVRKDLQGKGLGKFISRELERISRQKGINCLYLLTTTAKEFFSKEGYEEISREDAPESIKNSSEFSSVCPSSATLMRKYMK